MQEGLTFTDVLLVPKYSDIESRKQLTTKTQLTKNMWINTPIISANMDTVTESAMAIKMAELGGIGIIHRFLTIDKQVAEVEKVKRAHSYIIIKPYTVTEGTPIHVLDNLMKEKNIHCFLVTESNTHFELLKGLVTNRDTLLRRDRDACVKDIMTPLDTLVTYEVDTDHTEVDFERAKKLLRIHRIEKLPIINKAGCLKGLITLKDIEKSIKYPNASKDKNGNLLVGAAIGVKNDYIERATKLVEAGTDVLVIDIAHGHSSLLIKTLKDLKVLFPEVDIIAGNVATAEGTRDLIAAGADAIKCGIGGSGVCSTRTVSGAGVPQLTAIIDCVNAAGDVPVIADGGIKLSGDIVKALSAGASSVMIGSLLAGCEESPGLTRIKDDQKVKIYRGMASFDAAVNRTTAEKGYKVDFDEYVPEGVETIVPYKGKVQEVITQLVGGIQSGMSYIGAHSIEEMYSKAEFIKITSSGWQESIPHALKK